MNPIRRAELYAELVKHYGTEEKAATAEGIKRSTLAKYRRLLALPQGVKDKIRSNALTAKHGEALLIIPQKHREAESLDLPMMSANKAMLWAKERAKELQEQEKQGESLVLDAKPSPDQLWLEDYLRQKLRTRVKVRPLGAGCQIIIDTFTADQASDIVSRMLGEQGS